MNNLYLLKKKTGIKGYCRFAVIGLLSCLMLLVNGCASSGLEKPTKLITVYKKDRVVCLPPPKGKPLTLNDIKHVLGRWEEQNVIAITGEDYENASDNDKAKFEKAISLGLIALHYLDCINNHNEGIK